MMGGECATFWARETYPRPCQECHPASGVLLAVGIISEVFLKSFLNFVIAAMAATSAVKGSSKLHTSLIRPSLSL